MLEIQLAVPKKKSAGGNTKPFRYYRMWITARNEPNAITVGEWELMDADAVNRARGRPASASDQGFGNASSAFDGIIPANLSQARWQTNSPSHPQWLQVDLQAIVSITQFNLYVDTSQLPNYAQYSPRNWIFQGSLDNNVWEDILSVAGWTQAVWTSKRKHTWNADGSPVV